MKVSTSQLEAPAVAMHALLKFLLFHVLTCLRPNALGSEIINGHIAPPNSLLFMASMQDRFGKHGCGGSLISDNFVLTAAHCADPEFPHPARVVLGTHNLRNPRSVRSIAQMCKHPDYKRESLANDIMLLKLSEAVPVGGRIQLIKLPPPDINVTENQMCCVAGWGLTENGIYVDDLRVVDVAVVDQDVCEQRWRQVNSILPANILCAGGFGSLKGNCNGDSGGPLVYNGTVVGVVCSGDYECNDPRLPDIYTDVSKFRPWIDKVLSQNGC